jgi:hypothetical protein
MPERELVSDPPILDPEDLAYASSEPVIPL